MEVEVEVGFGEEEETGCGLPSGDALEEATEPNGLCCERAGLPSW